LLPNDGVEVAHADLYSTSQLFWQYHHYADLALQNLRGNNRDVKGNGIRHSGRRFFVLGVVGIESECLELPAPLRRQIAEPL
jgi:hypothetical protein